MAKGIALEESDPESSFLFLVCQVGVERLCKARIESRWPDYRFAFSRPGFLTYKLPDGPLAPGFDLKNEFVRTSGICIGRIEAADAEAAAKEFWERFGASSFDDIHVWQRDERKVGDRFEPGLSSAATEAGLAIVKARPRQPEGQQSSQRSRKFIRVNQVADVSSTVMDCVLVEPNQWWIGSHHVTTTPSSWPGGVPPIEIPEDMISRAYMKMHEAIAWSRIPFRPKDCCVEIGSAPGGAAQAMLEHGLHVIGIDPAKMAPQVAHHANFEHIQKRGRDVQRRELAKARWLMTDSNVTPTQTLDTVEDIVTHNAVNIRGMLLTLKLPNWKLAADLPIYLDRIRNWGFQYVRPRHLAFNRQEICIAALKNKSMRRFG